MSNFLAVATVTATLRRLLQQTVAQDVAGAIVTTLRPGEATTGLPATGVNVFLYHAMPSAALRNADLPSRRGDATVIQPPQAALELFYLLGFYGNDAALEPQRLLGSVVRTLHSRPILTREMIEATVADPTYAYLASSDLAEAPARVRFVPVAITPEEKGQLWSGIFDNSDYVLSLAYKASVVLISSGETPAPALPVSGREIAVRSFRQPLLERIEPLAGPQTPIVAGTALRLLGQRLSGEQASVRLGTLEIVPTVISDQELHLILGPPAVATDDLRAGLVAVQVLHPLFLGSSPRPSPGAESNVGSFLLRPSILDIGFERGKAAAGSGLSGSLTVEVSPPVDVHQQASLSLLPLPGDRATRGYVFASARRTRLTTSLRFDFQDVDPAAYLVQVRVDGAESPLVIDPEPSSASYGQYHAPSVQLG